MDVAGFRALARGPWLADSQRAQLTPVLSKHLMAISPGSSHLRRLAKDACLPARPFLRKRPSPRFLTYLWFASKAGTITAQTRPVRPAGDVDHGGDRMFRAGTASSAASTTANKAHPRISVACTPRSAHRRGEDARRRARRRRRPSETCERHKAADGERRHATWLTRRHVSAV